MAFLSYENLPAGYYIGKSLKHFGLWYLDAADNRGQYANYIKKLSTDLAEAKEEAAKIAGKPVPIKEYIHGRVWDWQPQVKKETPRTRRQKQVSTRKKQAFNKVKDYFQKTELSVLGKHGFYTNDTERREFTLYVVSTGGFTSQYGWVDITEWSDLNGRKYKTIGSNKGVSKGQIVRIKATVCHNEYRGEEQTLLKRISLQKSKTNKRNKRNKKAELIKKIESNLSAKEFLTAAIYGCAFFKLPGGDKYAAAIDLWKQMKAKKGAKIKYLAKVTNYKALAKLSGPEAIAQIEDWTKNHLEELQQDCNKYANSFEDSFKRSMLKKRILDAFHLSKDAKEGEFPKFEQMRNAFRSMEKIEILFLAKATPLNKWSLNFSLKNLC